MTRNDPPAAQGPAQVFLDQTVRRVRVLSRRLSRDVEHEAVLGRVSEAGALTGRYMLLTAMSAGIATLGLMQNSPAVIIGAMLVSPLMGPIVLLGFSFRTLAWRSAQAALASLGAGLGLAFVLALVLTALSPLKEPTEEILARTRPTLFDLAVAVFSGVAGAYAVIKGRGETIVGVAIATALMPPVATMGFGVGAGDWGAARGASLLFATNLVAIALAAAGMAWVYGFRRTASGAKGARLRVGATVLVIVLLCVPLSVSLQRISWETQTAAAARAALMDVFGPGARVGALAAAWTPQGGRVDAVVFTQSYDPAAPTRVRDRLSAAAGGAVAVQIDQITTAQPQAAAAAPPAPVDRTAALGREIDAAVPFPVEAVALDVGRRVALVALRADAGLDLAGAYAMEQGLSERFEGVRVEVSPPVGDLPAVTVTLAEDGRVEGPGLGVGLWALARWRVRDPEGGVCVGPSSRFEAASVAQAILQRPDAGALRLAILPPEQCADLPAGEARITLAPG